MKNLNFCGRVLLLLLFSALSLQAQQSTLGNLPAIITESSGLETFTDNDSLLWSHNDSGGLPDVYLFSINGQLAHTLHINNYPNIDWEDLAQDNAGNLFIGDFGNNNNNRTDLRILKINASGLPTSGNAAAITFHYPDQIAFPPASNSARNFDMEAMIYHNDSLYLFSKNVFSLTNPGTGYTKLYALPATPGDYTAQLIDSLYTFFPVTAADIAPSGKSVALLCYTRLYILYNFTGNNFFSGTKVMYNIAPLIPPKQTEAVVFRDCNSVYITDEEGELLLYNFAADFPQPNAQTASNGVNICAGDTAQLYASGGDSYTWLPQTNLELPNTATPLAHPELTTTYTLTAYNPIGCADTAQVLVSVENCPTATEISVKLWLEGAYNVLVQNMNTGLNTAQLLPLMQPFNRPPFNYTGNEGLSAPFIMPENAVDWVLLELRSAATQQVVSQRAVLLLSNGFLQDITRLTEAGTAATPLARLYNFSNTDSYYISVQTRNHLPLISALAQPVVNGMEIDFTQAANVQGSSNALKQKGFTRVACVGDGNIDGIISFEDFNHLAAALGVQNVYSDLDFNFDGVVDTADYQLYRNNVSRIAIPVLRH